jgi:glycosyltransferase involved in cell wall biosynthesis
VSPSVAIVHDYLTQRGGAERVVLAMADAFPGVPLYTSVYDPAGTFPEFADHDVRPLWTDRVGLLRRDHTVGLPLYPLAFSLTKIEADVTICSSSGFAHGVRTTGAKVVYSYTPARWLYEESEAYLSGWPAAVRAGARLIAPPLRVWDKSTVRSAAVILTSSAAVQGRITRHYGRDALVVPPPIAVDATGPREPVPGVEPGFLLSVGRLLAYKHVDVVVAAMTRLPEVRLVVAGDGPERDRLQRAAPGNVTFVGQVGDEQLRWLYANSRGLVSASYEDFGLTPVEAAAYGKPAAVLRRGGFLDTVVEGVTGVFFDSLHPHAVAEAVSRLLEHPWRHADLVARAARYSPTHFAAALHEVVDDAVSRRPTPLLPRAQPSAG